MKNKALSNILTVFKVAKILAKVVFILCIVGGAGCLVALSVLPFFGSVLPMELLTDEGLNVPSLYLACVMGAISCAGEAVLAFLAERYFGNVLAAGTPFTLEGSKECFRFGIASIIVSVAVSFVSGFAVGIAMILSRGASDVDVDASVSLTTGLFFLFLSMIFKYGAGLLPTEASTEEETK